MGRYINIDQEDDRPLVLLDQTNVGILHGTSGAGVFDKEGDIIGVMEMRIGSTKSFYVPARFFRDWLRSIELKEKE
jgi:S1-C subfamily serine protease